MTPRHRKLAQVPSRSWPSISLDPQTIRYRHDLESLFYVLVYVTSRYYEGREIDDPPLQEWDDLGEDALKSAKGSFLSRSLPKRTPHFEKFFTWIVEIRVALRAGITARNEYRDLQGFNKMDHGRAVFDDETLGGNLSFDTFGKILEKEI